MRRLPALGAAVALAALMLGALMPAAGADEGHGYIAGVVTAAIGGEPVPGVEVCAINRNGDGPWGCTTTNEAGVYTAPVSESGQYEVRFTAPRSSGLVRRTYYENTEAASEQTLVSAAVGVTTAGIDEQIPKGGEITGTVTNAITKAPVSELEVCANAVGVECVSTNPDLAVVV